MRLRIAGQLSQTEAGVNTDHKAVKLEVHTKSQTGIKATQTTVTKGIGTQLCITAGNLRLTAYTASQVRTCIENDAQTIAGIHTCSRH